MSYVIVYRDSSQTFCIVWLQCTIGRLGPPPHLSEALLQKNYFYGTAPHGPPASLPHCRGQLQHHLAAAATPSESSLWSWLRLTSVILLLLLCVCNYDYTGCFYYWLQVICEATLDLEDLSKAVFLLVSSWKSCPSCVGSLFR